MNNKDILASIRNCEIANDSSLRTLFDGLDRYTAEKYCPFKISNDSPTDRAFKELLESGTVLTREDENRRTKYKNGIQSYNNGSQTTFIVPTIIYSSIIDYMNNPGSLRARTDMENKISSNEL